MLTGICFSQVEKMMVDNETFFQPTLGSMGYLMANVDSVVWNESLLPMGFKSLPPAQKVNALEYKKSIADLTQYIGFDERFGVLTVIWKDESGNNLITNDLKKALKGKEHTTIGYYKTQLNGKDVIIGIESEKKGKGVNEMITIEIERK